jgi:hypothetical protein
VSKCLISLFCELGSYQRVISDNHSIFSNSFWSACLKLLKAQEVHTVAYRPEGNVAETGIKKTKKYLAMYCEDHKNWYHFLKQAEWASNQKVCSVTGFSPNTLQFGRDLPSPFSLDVSDIKVRDDNVVVSMPKYLEQAKNAFERAIKLADDRQHKVKVKQKLNYDKGRRPHHFKLGDRVYLKAVNLSSALKNEMASFHAKFKGPFIISRLIGANNFLIALPNSSKTWKVNADQLRAAVDPPSFVRNHHEFMSDYYKRSRKQESGGPKMKYDFRQRLRV